MNEKNQIVLMIEAMYLDLRPSERKAADFILRRGDDIRRMSLEKVARGSGVSQPTVMRLMKALGFSGYREFQYALVEESARTAQRVRPLRAMYGYHISREDKVSDIPARIVATAAEMMQKNLKSLSLKTFQRVVEVLQGARMIDIYGVENSSAAAGDLAAKLLYLGLNCRYFEDCYLQRIGASGLTSEDVAVGISYSGQSRDTVDAVREARERGAATVVITNFGDSLISRYADLVICTSQDQVFYGDAIFSRTAQMMIVDMIYMGIVVSDYELYAGRLDHKSRVISGKAYVPGTDY